MSAAELRAGASLAGVFGLRMFGLFLILPVLSVHAAKLKGGENLSLNCREGPISSQVAAGKMSLHQTFAVTASHPKSLKLCKAASAEFAPDPALDPLWINYWEPFHGAAKKDFGFQVIIKVAPDIQ